MMAAQIRCKIKNLHWSQWLGIAGLAALFFALRWNSCDAPLIRDEGDFAYSAQLLIQGVAPYEHAFMQKPPMVIYSYALSNLLLPQAFWSARLLAYLFVAMATVLAGYVARLEFGRGFALPTMWLMTPMVLLPGIEQFWASVEMLQMLPVLATIAIYCYSRRHGHKPKHWFAAAFFAVTAILYKYTALPVLAFVFICWFVEICRTVADRNSIWRCVIFAVAGTVAAALIELGYFLIHDGGSRLWECTVLFNRHYVMSGPFGPADFLSRLKDFWSDWKILFFLPCIGLFLQNPRIWFWFGALISAFFATSMSIYGHYYIIVMPFLALLGAAGINVLASQLNKMFKPSPRLGGLLTVVAVLLVIHPDVPWLLCSPERFDELKWGGDSSEFNFVADKVSQLSSPDDLVFIAGSEAQILYYAHRFSATRFALVYPLMIPGPDTLRYQREAIQDLEKHPPALIVFVVSPESWVRHPTTPPDFFNFLDEFLKRDYELAGGYVKENGREGHWSERLTVEEYKASNLLLYKRRFPATESKTEAPP